MNKLSRLGSLIAIIILILSACNLPSNAPATDDPNIVSTNAALTVQALLNQPTATFNAPTLPAPPTNTIIAPPTAVPPTSTVGPSATPNCDLAQFIKDVTIPDGTTFNAGDAFTKTWRLKNIGSCTWTGYALVFDSGDAMSGVSPVAIGTVGPGQEVDISASLKAPASNGTYRGYWRIRNGAGVLIPIQGGAQQGKSFFVEIKVGGGGGGGGGPFAVTSVTYSVTTWNSPGFVNCPKITANITVNGAGAVDYTWMRSDGPSGTGTLNFAAAGTQSISAQWSLGSFWAPPPDEWMGIYIDDPNHQDFGHATMPPCTTP